MYNYSGTVKAPLSDIQLYVKSAIQKNQHQEIKQKEWFYILPFHK